MASKKDDKSAAASAPAGEYIVVARRYRPQDFSDLVGQDMVAQALCNALETDRVGHAYLFTGARGVGKTSTARIFSKMLNCDKGPTTTPCNQCDICLSIAAGEDVDVLEIDGASNRGIDEIRQLRSNVGVRPSRGRYKVYIIDEVHMLTKEAFNALLKTLEEPPEHVKFIFCTTAPEKIPITVLSRCQRFDFSPVQQAQIVERLQEIVTSEGATAEQEALEILARRAAGSMRDSQSLLEQLLSFSGSNITVDAVHGMLGTAKNSRVTSLLTNLLNRDAAAALADVDGAMDEGVDAGQLAEQLMGSIRDLLALGVGCEAEGLRYSLPGDADLLREQANAWGVETLLAAVQIIDHALIRMRQSMHARIILETAMVRIARLEHLQSLANLVAQLEAGLDPGTVALSPAVPAPKKKGPLEPVASVPTAPDSAAVNERADAKPAPTSTGSTQSITDENVRQVWASALQSINDLTADSAAHCQTVKCGGPARLVLLFADTYNSSKTFCERADRRKTLEVAVSEIVGRPVQIEFQTIREDSSEPTPPKPVLTRGQLQRQATANPFVKSAMEMFDAEVSNIDSDERSGRNRSK